MADLKDEWGETVKVDNSSNKDEWGETINVSPEKKNQSSEPSSSFSEALGQETPSTSKSKPPSHFENENLYTNAKKTLAENPLFSDTNPNAEKNKKIFKDHLAQSGFDANDLDKISDDVKKGKELLTKNFHNQPQTPKDAIQQKYELGKGYQKVGDYDNALAHYDEVLNNSDHNTPDEPSIVKQNGTVDREENATVSNALTGKGDVLLAKKDYKGAIDNYTAVLQRNNYQEKPMFVFGKQEPQEFSWQSKGTDDAVSNALKGLAKAKYAAGQEDYQKFHNQGNRVAQFNTVQDVQSGQHNQEVLNKAVREQLITRLNQRSQTIPFFENLKNMGYSDAQIESAKKANLDIKDFLPTRSLIQTQEEKNKEKELGTSGTESYAGGALTAFNEGFNHDVLKVIDGAIQMLPLTLGGQQGETPIGKYGDKLVEHTKKDNAFGGSKTPEGFVGDVTSGVAGMIPMLATLAVAPETKGITKFGSQMGITNFFNTFGETHDLEKSAQQGIKSTIEGNIMDMLGHGAHGMGELAKELGASKSLTSTVKTAAMATGFGGYSAAKSALETGKVDWKEAQKNASLAAMGLPELVKDFAHDTKATRKAITEKAVDNAVTNFFMATDKSVDWSLGIEVPINDLRQQAIDYGVKAQDKTITEAQRAKYTIAQYVANAIADIKAIVPTVAENPELYNKVIDASEDMDDTQKAFYKEKVRRIAQSYNDKLENQRQLIKKNMPDEPIDEQPKEDSPEIKALKEKQQALIEAKNVPIVMQPIIQQQLVDVSKEIETKKEEEKHAPLISGLEEVQKSEEAENQKQIEQFKADNPQLVNIVPELQVELPKEEVDSKFYDKSIEKNFVNLVDKTKKTNDILWNQAGKLDGGLEELKSSLPTETIPLDKLVPTQGGFSERRFNNIKGEIKDLPLVVKIGDKYYIEDGHHRILKNIKDGEPIKAKVFDEQSLKETPEAEIPIEEKPTEKVEQKVEEAPSEPTQEQINHALEFRAHELEQLRKSQPKSYKEQFIHDNVGRVRRSDVEHYNDTNNLANQDDNNTWSGENLNFFNKDAIPLDTQAQQLSELAGIEITPNDIADYIIDRKNNPEKYHKQEVQKYKQAADIPIDVANVISKYKDEGDMNNPDFVESLRHFPLSVEETNAILKYLKDEHGKEPTVTNTKPSESIKPSNETKGQGDGTQKETGETESRTTNTVSPEKEGMATQGEAKPLTRKQQLDNELTKLIADRQSRKLESKLGNRTTEQGFLTEDDIDFALRYVKNRIEYLIEDLKAKGAELKGSDAKAIIKEVTDLFKKEGKELSDEDTEKIKKQIAALSDIKEGFTGLAKSNITDAEGIVLNFDKPEQSHWTNVAAEAISDLEKKAKSTSPDDMFNAAQAEIEDMAQRENYNPTDKDYATMLYHRVRLMDKLKEASKQMLDTDKNIQKIGEANYELYNELLKQNSDLVAEKRSVSGRSLSILGAVAKMDAKSGLEIKRMQVIKAKGGQWLTAKEEAALQEQHDNEIATAKATIERMKKNFNDELKRQVDIEVQKLKSRGTPKDRTVISQATKRLANNVRKLKIPKEYTGVRFDAGSWDMVVEAAATAIETTGKVAEAIKNTLDDLKLKYTDKDINDLVDKFKNANKEDILEKIKELSDEEKINTITKQSVAKNHIRELVRENIKNGLKGDDILEQTHKDLQTKFPEMTREQMNDAFLKRGDFKLESKEKKVSENKQIEKDLLEKTRLEKVLKDLEDNKEKEKSKIHEKSTNEEVLKVKKQIEKLKTNRKEAADAKKKFESELQKAGKEITDDLYKKKKSELEKAQNELDRRFDKEIADAEKLAKKQKEAELKRITKAKERELNKITTELEKEYKQKNKTELEKLQNELDRKVDKLAEIEQKIKDLQNGKVWNKKNNATAKVDIHIAKAKEELAKFVNKKKIKLERGNKLDLAKKKEYAERHNQRIEEDVKSIIDEHITDENRDELEAIKKLLDKSKVNIDSAEDLFSAVEKTKQITDTIRESLQGKPEYAEIRKAIDAANVERTQDFYYTEQKLKLAQYKRNAENAIKKNNRILERGEVTEPNSARPDMLDADAIRLDIAKHRSAMQVQKIIQKAERDRMGTTEKVIDFVMRAWVAQLVGNIKTGLVVGASALSKQPMETITRGTTGQLAPRVFTNLSHGAGAESATGFLRQERERYRAHYGAMSEEGLQMRIAKAQQNLTNADIAYENAKEKAKDLQDDYDKYYPLFGKNWRGLDEYNKRFDAVAQAKQAQLGATMDYLSNSIYQWIGSNSYKDAGEVFLHGTSKLEELLGKDAKEYFKDKDLSEKILYIGNMMAATHGMMKNFSARGQFAAEFMARMENKAKIGVDVRSPDEIIKTIAESYISFERGKFQQDNIVVNKFNNMMRALSEKDDSSTGRVTSTIAKAYLKGKQPVLRTSTNITSEAILDYTLGGILAPIMHIKEFTKFGKGGLKDIFSGETKSLSDFVSKGREYIKDLPPEKKDAILRAYRKGGFAATGYALAAIGVIQFGGFFSNAGNDKEKGKIKVFGEELSPLLSKIFMHSPFMMPSLLWSNAQKVAEKDGGLEALKSSIDAATETLPFAGEGKHAPFYQGLTVPTIGNITKGVGEMIDNDGTSIFSPTKRIPDSFMDWVKMNSGFYRKDVNSKEAMDEIKKNRKDTKDAQYKNKHLIEYYQNEDKYKLDKFEKEQRLSKNPKVQESRIELLKNK